MYGFDCYGLDRDGKNCYGYRDSDYDEHGLDKHGYNCLGYYKSGPGIKLSVTPQVSISIVKVRAASALARAQLTVTRHSKLKDLPEMGL